MQPDPASDGSSQESKYHNTGCCNTAAAVSITPEKPGRCRLLLCYTAVYPPAVAQPEMYR